MFKKIKKSYQRRIMIFALFFAILLLPKTSEAAILYFDPSEGDFGLGDEFSVNIKMDVTENCINTIEASIAFSSDIANLVDFSTGESFLDIWVEKPSTADIDKINESGIIYFAGGIPGGYCGKIPGDPGESNIVGTLHFRIPTFSVSNNDNDEINLEFLPKTRALINDGFGTEDALIKRDSVYTFNDDASFPQTEWQDRLTADRIPPEPFVIELQQNRGMFDNKFYIVFNTSDKQTGIDHYEVLELKPGEAVNVKPEQSVMDILLSRDSEPPHWVVAQTPHLLLDQSLESVIKVKAVDKAGNERLVEYIPNIKTEAVKTYSVWPLFMLLLLIMLVIILVVAFTHKYIKRRKQNVKDQNS